EVMVPPQPIRATLGSVELFCMHDPIFYPTGLRWCLIRHACDASTTSSVLPGCPIAQSGRPLPPQAPTPAQSVLAVQVHGISDGSLPAGMAAGNPPEHFRLHARRAGRP